MGPCSTAMEVGSSRRRLSISSMRAYMHSRIWHQWCVLTDSVLLRSTAQAFTQRFHAAMYYHSRICGLCRTSTPAARRYSRALPKTTCGPQGVDGRLPATFHKISHTSDSGLAIVDPFIVYQNYVKQGKLNKDEQQLRAMKEFQKLFYRLVDYRPEQEMAIKKSLLIRKLEVLRAEEEMTTMSERKEPLSRLRQLFRRDINAKKRDVVRFLTDEEELRHLASPRGLLINGEVGCGKSMLMDLFASSLPHHLKMRWHYSNFILWVFGEIHRIQKERTLTTSIYGKPRMTMENEFILFEIAQKMMDRLTVFMLDEFMLPDVAAAQIIKLLFTYYFKLGGVLVATSNKLPEELYSSEFNKSRFRSFVSILNCRCIAVDMNSRIDYRHHFAQNLNKESNMVVELGNPHHLHQWTRLVTTKALQMDQPVALGEVPWLPAQISVYNRTSHLSRTYDGRVCYLDFDTICRGLYSSSDYITLASTYPTVVVDHVPVMTSKMKNEARRFITLLDALYEARCQLFLRTEVALEDLFFPDAANDCALDVDRHLVQQEEMFAKTAMQTLNPYRPNVSSYDQDYAKRYNVESDSRRKNFSNVKAFTGEDEQFAYKRAISRVREMVSSDHWRSSDKWIPIHDSMRPWETKTEVPPSVSPVAPSAEGDFLAREIKDIKASLRESSPRALSEHYDKLFREFNSKVAPAFPSLLHFWGIGEWTHEQRRKIKDKIARSWVSGGIKH